MSNQRRTNLIKTLSKEDIHQALDKFGSEQVISNPLKMTEQNDGPLASEKSSDQSKTTDRMKFYVEKTTTMQEEWNQLFHQDNFSNKLRFNALDGNLGTKYFRSVCWRIFWECLSDNVSCWIGEVQLKRRQYTDIRKKYVIDPYDEQKQDMDLGKHHPLSQAEDSIWHKYFQDNELRSTIMQDLDRLCPENDFFQQEKVKSIILHILFCYARENPQVAYKQGMHEILSPVIYVIITDTLTVENCTDDLSEDIQTVMDMNFIEQDVYWLFCNMMESLEPWYTNKPEAKQENQLPNDQRMFRNPNDMQLVSAISKKLNCIQGYMLKRFDVDLWDHLKRIEITPQLYGIRWIRLLFGREFALHRLLTLWDAIFADGIALDLVDYIYLAMLINLRGVLLQSDVNNCLAYLMKYPANTDTKYILKRAVSLKNHKTRDSAHSSHPSKTHSLKTIHLSHQQHLPHQQQLSHKKSSLLDQAPKHKKPVHPVRNRLGDTKEQRYANALGSGHHQHESIHQNTSHQSTFYTNNGEVEDGTTSAKTEFTETKPHDKNHLKGTVASQISNLKTKVASPTQIISRISNPLRNKNQQHRQRSDSVTALVEDHSRLQQQVSDLQSKLDKLQSLCLYCGGKMDVYLTTLQNRLLKEEGFSDEIGILSLAGLKQVREIIKNGVMVRGSTLDYEIDFNDIDRHIQIASGESIPKLREDTPKVLLETMPVAYLADFDHFDKTSNSNEDLTGANQKNILLDKDVVSVNDFNIKNVLKSKHEATRYVSPLESSDVMDTSSKYPLVQNTRDKHLDLDELNTVFGLGNTSLSVQQTYDPLSISRFDSEHPDQ